MLRLYSHRGVLANLSHERSIRLTDRITYSPTRLFDWVAALHVVVALLTSGILARPATAEIKFEDTTERAGFSHRGQTYGASWGDLNSDGWPDLWVSNHTLAPSVYLNGRDGTFRDVGAEVATADPSDDTHAAAWADFDNDGDQDLVELVGAIISDTDICFGCGPTHFFNNDQEKMVEVAEEVGLHSPIGLGRTPLWLDADRDGRLDLLVTYQPLKDMANTVLYHQSDRGIFRVANQKFGVDDIRLSKFERGWKLLENLMGFRLYEPFFDADRFRSFAQLADLTGDGSLELVLYSQPIRIYSTDTVPFVEITGNLVFPRVGRISDAAIEDFDGDGQMDIYVTRGPYTMSEVIQTSSTFLKAMIGQVRKDRDGTRSMKGFEFRSKGPIEVEVVYPYWIDPSMVLIGSGERSPTSFSFTLRPDDPGLQAPLPKSSEDRNALLVDYDPETETWRIRNGTNLSLNYTVRGHSAIERLKRTGFEAFREQGSDALLMRRDGEFVEEPLGDAGLANACHNVVAGDFDNDMDMDLFLACAGPIENIPNQLLENDGVGHFSLVSNGGGAAGSRKGRADVVVSADYDRDGFLDIFVANGSDPSSPFIADGPHQLFHNQGGSNHWIELDLVGTTSNRDGIGASVTIEAGGVIQQRGQGGGMHVFAQSHSRLHVGLGPNKVVDRLSVTWPSGRVQELKSVPADQILRIEEPKP
jgi:hypothetical protein